MPFTRPTLSELRQQVLQDIKTALPGSDPLLRFSNLGIMGQAQAGLAHLHMAFLDWIARQAVPYTATAEYLEAWAVLKGVTRLAAARATGTATFIGTTGTVLPNGTSISRADGKTFTTTASGTVGGGGTVTVPLIADADPTGLTGAWGDMIAGTALTLASAVPGIQSTGLAATIFTGGADLEDDDSLRSRMLFEFQNQTNGGSRADYLRWAKLVPGVTRAWCVPEGMGAGTVQVFVMLDDVQAAFGGFPQGTNGVATSEPRAAAATGDQLAVADAIYPVQPATALVYVLAPTANVVNFTISGLSTATVDVKNAVKAAIASSLKLYGELAGTTNLSLVESAIAAVPSTSGFIVTAPAANIVSGAGQIPTMGTVTYV